MLYASHGTAVNVVELRTEKQVAPIGNRKGAHGIAVADGLHGGFISDGKAAQQLHLPIKYFEKRERLIT